MLLTIVSFVAVLVVLVIVHELGHFGTAKAFGVKVEEFGVGFPPRLLSLKRGETVYSINAIPLGGFVKLAGEEDPNVSHSLASQSAGRRILILAAGSLMNAILPVLLFSIAFMLPHSLVDGQVIVQQVAPGSPAALAGMQTGDIVLSVNGKAVHNINDMQRNIQLNLGQQVTVTVKHPDATTANIKVIPRWRPPIGQGAVGIILQLSSPKVIEQSYPFWQAIPMGAVEGIETFVLFKNGIISMIIGTAPAAVAGPVGIAQITGEVARAGISPLLEFAGFLSINLALVNIFPLPALDGGRIAFVVLEWIRRGKRVSPRIESTVHLIGFALLMAAILVITYQDILRIIAGNSLIP